MNDVSRVALDVFVQPIVAAVMDHFTDPQKFPSIGTSCDADQRAAGGDRGGLDSIRRQDRGI